MQVLGLNSNLSKLQRGKQHNLAELKTPSPKLKENEKEKKELLKTASELTSQLKQMNQLMLQVHDDAVKELC